MNTLLSIMLQKYWQLQPLLAFLMLFLFPALPNTRKAAVFTNCGLFLFPCFPAFFS